jgi:hypothetical protein
MIYLPEHGLDRRLLPTQGVEPDLARVEIELRAHQAVGPPRIDGIAPGNVGLRFTIGQSSEHFLPLMRGELVRPTKPHAASLSALSAIIGAGED